MAKTIEEWLDTDVAKAEKMSISQLSNQFFFRDPTEEIIYLHKQITIPSGETPDEYVHYLLDRESKGVPIALPHDASAPGRYTLTEQSVREVFEDSYGLNCIPGAILNPPNDQGKVTNHKA
jgi:hypothetical protein